MSFFNKLFRYIKQRIGNLKGRLRRSAWEKAGCFFRNRFGVCFYLPNCYEDLIQTLIIENEFFDFAVLKDIQKFIKADSVILDIGANIGNHSLYFARFCRPQKIYAFEPVPETYAILTANIEGNQYGDIITVYPFGVGDTAGRARISKFNHENIGGTELLEDAEGSIELISIDAFLPALTKLDFIKIDVEGFENRVLEGAVHTIQRFKPTIYIEIFEENFNGVNQWLTSHGYEIVKQYYATDYIYVHKSRIAEA